MSGQTNITTPHVSAAIPINSESMLARALGGLLTKRNHLSAARADVVRARRAGDWTQSPTLLTLSLHSVDTELNNIRRAQQTGLLIRPRVLYTDGAHQRRGTRRGGGRHVMRYDIVDVRDGRIVAERTRRDTAERFIEKKIKGGSGR